MPRRQRAAVMFLFSLGFLVTIVGCVRTWYIYKALVLEYDLTWYSYPLWIAAAIEIDVGVVSHSSHSIPTSPPYVNPYIHIHPSTRTHPPHIPSFSLPPPDLRLRPRPPPPPLKIPPLRLHPRPHIHQSPPPKRLLGADPHRRKLPPQLLA